MSLIQAALDRTQIHSKPQENRVPASATYSNFDSLQNLDHEVETRILELQSQFRKRSSETYKKIGLFVFAGFFLFFIIGAIYWVHNYSNNTRIAFDTPGSQARFNLGGIAWGGKQPFALINGRVFKMGDAVEPDVIVRTIERDYVMIDFRGTAIRLILKR